MKKIQVIAILLALVMLCGCVTPAEKEPLTPKDTAESESGSVTETETESESESGTESSEQIIEPDEREYTVYEPENLTYNELNDEDKAYYDEIYAKIQALEPIIYTREDDGYEKMDRLIMICWAISKDHPDINNYFKITEVNDDEGLRVLAMKSDYFYLGDTEAEHDNEFILDRRKELEDVADSIIGAMPEGITTFEKYHYLAASLSALTEYDYSLTKNGIYTLHGVFFGKYAVCQGYAEAYQYICNRAGLWCRLVSGASKGEGHAWNLIKLYDGTYFVDVTWSDENTYPSREWERYFCMTQKELLLDHEISDESVATGEVYSLESRSIIEILDR